MSLFASLDPVLDASYKGFPSTQAPRRRSEVGAAGWNVLRGDLALPLAVLHADLLTHNLGWMQNFVRERGIELAPHGKTTMSPQLFRRQLEEGAWGMTFATIFQLRVGAESGVRQALIANQVFTAADLGSLNALRQEFEGLRVAFLVDSLAQLAEIESWFAKQSGVAPFDVLLEVGIVGGRTGTRDDAQAEALAAALHASPAVRLCGIECYEGGGATGDTEKDKAFCDALMVRVSAIAKLCDANGWFADDEVLMSAGGSAIFDLVATQLTPNLSRPVRGILRSGCYITHDHGFYKRLVNVVNHRIGCTAGGLQPALEVWAAVQSCPETGLAILAVGRRDISFDIALPTPEKHFDRSTSGPVAAPAGWEITALNDQHAYLRWPADVAGPRVGDLIALGISHPCTTFDKWRWMPVVDTSYNVTDAIVTCF
ncbi:amino acid deaminase [Pigmentiphaga aceris]|uniref:Amino acid deaminase n=1 Tax=Pigmentiphaga aceris TaxID=1940612 RepID=A0A5C0AYT7_9BURK|nr:alanine racemase [Pigmentiphaga aceris]QEI05741.1 amino acid deaminase [Pigmentiphaga aceris]